MKKYFGLAAALLALSASASHAQYTNNVWMQTWDFSSGSQGFTGYGANAFWDSSEGGGSLAVIDNSTWELPYLFKFGAAHNPKFVLQVDLLFKAANSAQAQYFGLLRGSDNRGPALGGGNGNNWAIQGRDRSWDNTNRSRNFALGKDNTGQNVWYTLQIDYGWTTPGQMRFFLYSPIETNSQAANTWYEWHTGVKNVNPDPLTTFTKLVIGANYGASGFATNGSQGWGQSRWDNLKIVPEPGSIVALGSGLVGMAGMIIRRKK